MSVSSKVEGMTNRLRANSAFIAASKLKYPNVTEMGTYPTAPGWGDGEFLASYRRSSTRGAYNALATPKGQLGRQLEQHIACSTAALYVTASRPRTRTRSAPATNSASAGGATTQAAICRLLVSEVTGGSRRHGTTMASLPT
jgi:hypothetical protein